MERICGFIVVRKPEYAKNETLKSNMNIGKKVYRGIDRLRWEDVELAYYDRHLPEDIIPIWRKIAQDTADFSGIKLLKDYRETKKILDLSNDWCEVIAIWSPYLEEIKGAFHCGIDLTYLGLDCFSIGEWSVILSGVYEKPTYFTETITQLNKDGLLTSVVECDALYARYLELSSSEIVEPLMEGARATNIKIFSPIQQ